MSSIHPIKVPDVSDVVEQIIDGKIKQKTLKQKNDRYLFFLFCKLASIIDQKSVRRKLTKKVSSYTKFRNSLSYKSKHLSLHTLRKNLSIKRFSQSDPINKFDDSKCKDPHSKKTTPTRLSFAEDQNIRETIRDIILPAFRYFSDNERKYKLYNGLVSKKYTVLEISKFLIDPKVNSDFLKYLNGPKREPELVCFIKNWNQLKASEGKPKEYVKILNAFYNKHIKQEKSEIQGKGKALVFEAKKVTINISSDYQRKIYKQVSAINKYRNKKVTKKNEEEFKKFLKPLNALLNNIYNNMCITFTSIQKKNELHKNALLIYPLGKTIAPHLKRFNELSNDVNRLL